MRPTNRAQVAIVTGASRGLGRALTLALLRAGTHVAAVARSRTALESLAADGGAASGRVLPIAADVTDSEAAAAALDEVRSTLGRPDLLICAAGIGRPYGPFGEADIREWWRTLSVNLLGTAVWCRVTLPQMREAGRGTILNVASGAGTSGIPYLSAYVTSKAAVIRLTEVIAAELARGGEGIGIASIEPGTIRTSMTEDVLHSADGQRWLPWMADIFREGRDVSMNDAVQFVMTLAAGVPPHLRGQLVVNR